MTGVPVNRPQRQLVNLMMEKSPAGGCLSNQPHPSIHLRAVRCSRPDGFVFSGVCRGVLPLLLILFSLVYLFQLRKFVFFDFVMFVFFV